MVVRQVCKVLLPVCSRTFIVICRVLAQATRICKLIHTVLADSLDNLRDKGIFLSLKVALLDLLEQFFVASLCNDKGQCRSATLKSHFSRILQVADQEILFDKGFVPLVPIGITRYCLLDGMSWVSVRSEISRWASCISHIALRTNFLLFLWLGLATQLIEEVCSTFG